MFCVFITNPVVFDFFFYVSPNTVGMFEWTLVTNLPYIQCCFCSQTIGCVTSLLLISPKLSGVMLIIIPTVIGGGTLLGSVLRKFSREAQEQVFQPDNIENCETLLTFQNNLKAQFFLDLKL